MIELSCAVSLFFALLVRRVIKERERASQVIRSLEALRKMMQETEKIMKQQRVEIEEKSARFRNLYFRK